MSAEHQLKARKVNTTGRLSRLARWIVLNTGDGIDRADIVARYFGIERLYFGFYTDPCFGPKQRREHDRKFRRANPRVTMALKRLEKAGLVRLIRRDKNVKRIYLTGKGVTVSNALDNSDRSRGSNDR